MRFPLVLLLTAAAAVAQVHPGIFGYQVQSTSGTSGEFCFVFDCTPRPSTAVAGETLTLRVNAPLQAFFAIGLSLGASNCVPFPLIHNDLVLDMPIYTLAVGVVSTPSPILACWGATETVLLPLPPNLPQGFAFATQSVAAVPSTSVNSLAFSVAVLTTIL
jgi:hypothetical protein